MARSARVLIDGTMATRGGGFTYLVNILPHLARNAPDHHFRVMLRNERLAESLPVADNVELDLLPPVGLAGRLRFTHLEAPRIAKRWAADLYFSAGESAPVHAPCPTIASFRNPNVFTDLDQGWPRATRLRLAALRGLARMSARTCDRIMFVSEDSARWIGDALRLPAEKRAVVHHGIDVDRWSKAPGPSPHPWPYILSVSSIYRYKNFVRLIEAYGALARYRQDLPDLVIIGDDQDPAYAARMRDAREASGVADQIHLLGEVPYAAIRDWYAGADLFAFPSYLETFGHPLLEAMGSEIPVVAADIPVFREIAGDAAFYADPHDATSLALAIHDALFREEARKAFVKRGRERVAQFGWERTAQRLLALFEDVVGERRAAHLPLVLPAPASAPVPVASAAPSYRSSLRAA